MKTPTFFLFDKRSLTYKKISIASYTALFTFLVFITFSYLIFILGYRAGEKKTISNLSTEEKALLTLKLQRKVFTKEEFKNILIQLNVKHPDIVYAQALQECGFSSRRFKTTNSLFSLRKARNRPSTAIGYDDQGYAVYSDWVDSVIDYALFQAANMNDLKTRDEYLQGLRSYAEDSSYVDRIVKLLPNFTQL